MKIADIRTGQGKIDVTAEVTQIGETRTFERFGRTIRVATAKIKDDSGEIALSLWNEDIDKVKVGDRIKLSNGFAKEFQGEKQLTAGRLGKIEVLKETAKPEASEPEAGEETAKPEAGEAESKKENEEYY